jgi:hypothetical protein
LVPEEKDSHCTKIKYFLVKKDPKNLVPVKKKSVSNSSCKKKERYLLFF